MKESTSLVCYLFLVGTICVVNYIIKITIHPAKGNDPIYYISGTCIVIIFLLGYVLYVWKSEMSELRKRFLFAMPFALMFLILAKIAGLGNFWSIAYGMIMCLMLLFKASSWKQHFGAIMIPPSIIIILCKFVVNPLFDAEWQSENAFLKPIISIACIMPALSFSLLYLSKLLYTSTPPDIRAILIRSVKFSVVVSLFFTAFLILTDFGGKQGISLPIQLLISSLLSISFVVICYVFDLSLIERKKKKNRSTELREELQDFYLQERTRIK